MRLAPARCSDAVICINVICTRVTRFLASKTHARLIEGRNETMLLVRIAFALLLAHPFPVAVKTINRRWTAFRNQRHCCRLHHRHVCPSGFPNDTDEILHLCRELQALCGMCINVPGSSLYIVPQFRLFLAVAQARTYAKVACDGHANVNTQGER